MNRMRLSAGLAVTMVLLPVQANAQAPAAERDAVQQAYVAGDLDLAEELLNELLAQDPDDPDLLRRLAALQAGRQDLAAAQATIDRAMGLVPQDSDIQLARANILLWRGRLDEALAQRDQIAAERPDYPGLAPLNEALRQARQNRSLRLRSLGIGTSISDASFASGLGQTWYVQRGSVAAQWGTGNVAAIDIEREKRNSTDTRVAGRIDLAGSSSRYFFFGSITPNADFRENWSLGGGSEFDLNETTTLQFDGRYAEYRNDDVVAVGAGLRHRFTPALEVSARSIHLFGGGEDYRLGGTLRVDYRNLRLPELFAIIASYPDAEVDGTRQLRAVAGGARIALSDHIVLGLTGEYESREDSYERTAFSVDLRWRFGG